MAAPPVRTELADTYPLPTNATFRTGIGKLWDYVTTLLGASGTAADARTALAVLGTAGGNMTGGINSARGNITQHATTMDFFAVTSPDILDGTGSAVTITACANAPQAGAVRKFYPLVNTILTHGATFDVAGNANLTAAAGDCWIIEAKTTSTYRVVAVKEDGTAVVAPAATPSILVQAVEGTPYTTYGNTATSIPSDNTIPQNGEGAEWATVTITPTNASNRLRIEAYMSQVSTSDLAMVTAALFQDSTAGALAAATVTTTTAGYMLNVAVVHEMAAGTTSATTFKLRAGANTGTLYVNGSNTTRLLGGVSAVRIRVSEIKV